jgi:hypothetical protein
MSIIFDTIFLIQHYILYPEARRHEVKRKNSVSLLNELKDQDYLNPTSDGEASNQDLSYRGLEDTSSH